MSEIDIIIKDLNKQIKFYEEQIAVLGNKVTSLKKRKKRENKHPFLKLFDSLFPLVVINLCSEFTDFSYCSKCNSLYSKYGCCFHKILKAGQMEFPVNALDCKVITNSDCVQLITPNQLTKALPDFKDKNIWEYFVLQLNENRFYFDYGECADFCGTLRTNLKLIIYPIVDRYQKQSILVHFNDGSFRCYYACANKCIKTE